MKRFARILSAAGLALGLALSSMPAGAQQPATPKPASPAAIAAAKEILAMKNASAMYAAAVPNIVQQTKETLMQSNLNYQKDLNEVADNLVKQYSARSGELMNDAARIYASHFTEPELRQLLTFYQSPLGQKVLAEEPKAADESMAMAGSWGDKLSEEVIIKMRDEMKKRGHDM